MYSITKSRVYSYDVSWNYIALQRKEIYMFSYMFDFQFYIGVFALSHFGTFVPSLLIYQCIYNEYYEYAILIGNAIFI